MSPEQLAGKKVDGRSDLYSTGVMLFQLLTGVLPFRGESMSQLMFKIATEEATDIRMIRPELPEFLSQVIASTLQKSPDARYQTGAQLASDLRKVIAQIENSVTVPASRRPDSSSMGTMDIEI
jgi:serine/threonine-protein kinase